MANRFKKANSIQTRWMWQILAGLVVLTVGALFYIFQQIRIHQLADDVKKLEIQVSKAREKNHGLRLQVMHLRSPKILQERVREMKLGLLDVSEKDSGILVVDGESLRRLPNSLMMVKGRKP